MFIGIFILIYLFVLTTFFFKTQSTFRLSLLAAGSTIELVDKIMDGEIRNGFALIRLFLEVKGFVTSYYVY